MIRAVIFDLGHTIWDIGPHAPALERAYDDALALLASRLRRADLPEARALQRAVRDVLIEASETYFASDGTYATTTLQVEQPPSTRWIDLACRSLGLELDDALLREITPPLFSTELEGLVCAEGTTETLHELTASGYHLGCVTNTLADGAGIRAMLRRQGIEDIMESVVVSADEGYRKPHALLFEKAMRGLCAAPNESVFVGDSPVHDIAGAKAAGMFAVLTQQYAARPYETFDPQPDAVITHVRELPAVIARLEAMPAKHEKC